MKTLAARIIRTFGFRSIMMVNAIVNSVFLTACALFIPGMLLPITIILLVDCFFRKEDSPRSTPALMRSLSSRQR